MKLISAFLCSLAISSITAHHVLYPRENSPTSTIATLSTNPAQSQTSDGSATITSTNSNESGLPSPAVPNSISSQDSQESNTTSVGIAPSGTTTAPQFAATNDANDTTPGDPNPLPLAPKLTPAVGVAGAILMITGLAYSLVGIKNQWLYSFFGVAYLVSVAVTVLIIYCMNPPVSDAVQGAFLVAVIFAASIAGGAGLIFRDIVDGVSCMLGGFCLAMWFLCLKDGGLISSVAGKAIFIGCMSVAVFALSLWPRTRSYALIGSIPFSGATATILGVDCFSRAGLKEFWIYIWNINDNEFPLNTNTYPMTRGIRVEVAGIILLFLLGLATQFKLSKIMRQRQESEDVNRLQRERDLEREETAAGKRVEKNIERERMRWESVYGDGKAQSYGSASTDTVGKSPGSEKEKRVSTMSEMEMSDISTSTRDHQRANRQSRTTVNVTSVDDAREVRKVPWPGQANRFSAAGRVPSRRSPVSDTQPAESNRRSNASPPPAPEVVPLPFRIPGIEVEAPSRQGSLSAIEDSYLNKRLSKRSSAGTSSALHRLSMGKMPEASASQEDLVTTNDDDNASSAAATFDELDEDDRALSAMTVPRSPMDAEFSQLSPRPSHESFANHSSPVDAPMESKSTVERVDSSGAATKVLEKSTHDLDSQTDVKQRSLDHVENDVPKMSKNAEDETSLNIIHSGGLETRTESRTETLPKAMVDTALVAEPEGKGTIDLGPKNKNKDTSDIGQSVTAGSGAAFGAVQKELDPSTPEGHSEDVKEASETTMPVLVSGENPATESEWKELDSSATERQPTSTSENRQSTTSEEQKETVGQSDESQAPAVGNLADHLPDNVSKVVLQYRTNEWAKHLSLAETPEPDELSDPPSPGIKVDTSFQAASSKDRTPLSPVVDPDRFVGHPITNRSSTTPSEQDISRIPSVLQTTQSVRDSAAMSRTPSRMSGNPTPPTSSLTRNSSTTNIQPTSSLSRTNSATDPQARTIPTLQRNYSSPLLGQPLVKSPVESPTEETRFGTLKRVGSDTVPVPSQPRNTAHAQSSPNLVLAGSYTAQVGADGIPLAYRSSVGKRTSSGQDLYPSRSNSRQDLQPSRSNSRQGLQPTRIQSRQTLPTLQATFDHHPPQRNDSPEMNQKREARLDQWRESLKQERIPQTIQPAFDHHPPQRNDSSEMRQQRELRARAWQDSLNQARNPHAITQNKIPVVDESWHAKLINEKREKEYREERERLAKVAMQNQIGNMMRNSNLIDVHKQKLRNMQAAATQNAPIAGESWKSRIVSDTPSQNFPVADESWHARLINEKREKEFREEQVNSAKEARQEQIGKMMRNSNMDDVHKEALRRMQAGVKTAGGKF